MEEIVPTVPVLETPLRLSRCLTLGSGVSWTTITSVCGATIFIPISINSAFRHQETPSSRPRQPTTSTTNLNLMVESVSSPLLILILSVMVSEGSCDPSSSILPRSSSSTCSPPSNFLTLLTVARVSSLEPSVSSSGRSLLVSSSGNGSQSTTHRMPSISHVISPFANLSRL